VDTARCSSCTVYWWKVLRNLESAKGVLVVPPDQSRMHSLAGDLTRYACEYYGDQLKAVMPALGTHAAMQPEQIARMFGAMPIQLFRAHNSAGATPISTTMRRQTWRGKLNLTASLLSWMVFMLLVHSMYGSPSFLYQIFLGP
jgi:hypothetical protein